MRQVEAAHRHALRGEPFQIGGEAHQRGRRVALPFFAASTLLFYAGIAFAYFVVFRLLFSFFFSTAPDFVVNNPDIEAFLSFWLTIILAFGIAFEVPIATVMLIWSGLVNAQTLAKARPYVFLGAFVVGMFLTPPDVISQTLLAVPVYLLYELGIFMAKVFAVRDKKDEEQSGPAE